MARVCQHCRIHALSNEIARHETYIATTRAQWFDYRVHLNITGGVNIAEVERLQQCEYVILTEHELIVRLIAERDTVMQSLIPATYIQLDTLNLCDKCTKVKYGRRSSNITSQRYHRSGPAPIRQMQLLMMPDTPAAAPPPYVEGPAAPPPYVGRE